MLLPNLQSFQVPLVPAGPRHKNCRLPWLSWLRLQTCCHHPPSFLVAAQHKDNNRLKLFYKVYGSRKENSSKQPNSVHPTHPFPHFALSGFSRRAGDRRFSPCTKAYHAGYKFWIHFIFGTTLNVSTIETKRFLLSAIKCSASAGYAAISVVDFQNSPGEHAPGPS